MAFSHGYISYKELVLPIVSLSSLMIPITTDSIGTDKTSPGIDGAVGMLSTGIWF